jgi:hypothetical protein
MLISNNMFAQQDWEVIEWQLAYKLKEDAIFIKTLNSNLCKLFKCNDSSYLLMPLNPFGKCILTKDTNNIIKWETGSFFPTNEDANKYYFDNAYAFNNLKLEKQKLKNLLLDFVYKQENKPIIVNDEVIQDIFNFLKRKKVFKKYSLHFILLVGDFLIENHKEQQYFWGVLKSRQLLNPIMELVLVTNKDGIDKYFDIQNKVIGKYGFFNINETKKYFQQFWKKPDNIVITIKKI